MPKKSKRESDLTIVRKGLDLSQAEFARRLGVSASIIKKLEEGKRTISQDLTSRIFAETGVLFVNAHLPDEPFSYTKEDHAQWLKDTQLDQKGAKVATGVVMKLVELMLVAAARPGVQKSSQVFHAIIQAIEKVKTELHLEKHIDAELRDRHSTETKQYSVRELRDNDLLAKSVGFKDDPKLKDDEILTLTKATGWLPAKEFFNVWWQHRELVGEILKSDGDELPDETRAKLEQLGETLEKAMDKEVSKLLPSGSPAK
jgi:DNA-binding XRE family transcriptional regulator